MQVSSYSSRDVYTRSDIEEIVWYANLKGVQIIPEVSLPSAASAIWNLVNNQHSKTFR